MKTFSGKPLQYVVYVCHANYDHCIFVNIKRMGKDIDVRCVIQNTLLIMLSC